MPTFLQPCTSRPHLVTLGETLFVLLADSGRPIETASHYLPAVAGSEANVAVALARLGRSVAFATRVGDDAIGRRVIAELIGSGISGDFFVRDALRPTGLLMRDYSGSRSTSVVYFRSGSAGSALSETDADALPVPESRCLLVTGLTMSLSESACAAAVRAVERAVAHSVPVILDPNLRRSLAPDDRYRQLLRPVLPHITLLVGGADEVIRLAGADDLEAATKWIRDLGVAAAVIHDGTRPVRAFTPGGDCTQEVDRVPLVDPVGAGDAFAAGLLHSWLDDPDDMPAALKSGCALAGLVVATPGDQEGLPWHLNLTALGPGTVSR